MMECACFLKKTLLGPPLLLLWMSLYMLNASCLIPRRANVEDCVAATEMLPYEN
jgi:hypothetical protein